MASPPPRKGSGRDIYTPEPAPLTSETGFDDCLSCRLTGSAAFIGLGVYTYYTGMNNLQKRENIIMQSPTKYKMGSRRLGIATMSAALVGMGVYRLIN
ncbi:hypothetical protein BJX61DRAFT_541390 [Aspergillus egyptiacus]|nr:hypothetical protein BJX61DRAFT_541390 [Aspergillus egyptiacus]